MFEYSVHDSYITSVSPLFDKKKDANKPEQFIIIIIVVRDEWAAIALRKHVMWNSIWK